MKAAILYELNKPLMIKDISLPKLQPGQVLVKIAYTGICHSQIMEVTGQRGPDRHLPHLLGHEATGLVKDVGPKVTRVKAGDRTVLSWIKGEGQDVGGASFFDGEHTISAGPIATFNEYAIVSENRCHGLPDAMPMDIGTLFGCAIPTGAGIVLNEIDVQENHSILIMGLGGVGFSALLTLNLFTFSQLIAVDISASRLKMAKKFGATHTIDAARQDVREQTMNITHQNGVDYSIEATGLATGIELAFDLVKKNGGLCIFASHPKAGDMIRLDPHALISGKRIRGTWGGQCNPDRDLPILFELYLKHKLPLEWLIAKTYNLDQINEGLDDLANHRVVRPIIEIDGTIK